MKKLLKKEGVQTLLASLICILIGILVGYIVLLCIKPAGAGEAIKEVLKNFMHPKRLNLKLKSLGNTVTKTMPLILCSLSILFAYKVGLFNIGAAGQYVAGACASLYAGLAWHWGWVACLLFAIAAGALLGAIVGFLKSYCNVNEVISGIMLNWIALYGTNTLLSSVKEEASPYTRYLEEVNPGALLPKLGKINEAWFGKNQYVTVAVPLTLLITVIILVVLDKTRFGYELKATGNNKFAAKYCGMAEKRNIILTLVIAGGLAGLGASFLFQTGYMRWECTQSSVPGMGFNGIAAAFLGGLNPIGSIFSSFFIQHSTDGGSNVDMNLYCAQISDLISSMIIYLCGFVLFIKLTIKNVLSKSDAKAAAAASAKGGDR